MPRRVLITVGEVSGDANAAQLAIQLRKLEPGVIIEGLGGPAMQAAGVTIHHDTVSRAAMGLGALMRIMEVRRLLKWTRDYYRRTPPDLHVCVDSWSMNWHFARLAKQFGRPVLYYIAPQAWASRPGRVKRLRQFTDRLACILPFEEQWFSARGVNATFVGHPLFDRLAAAAPSARPTDGPPVIGLLPGSRSGIARKNLPSLLDAAALVHHEFKSIKFVIPTTRNTDRIVRDELERRGIVDGYEVVLDEFDDLVGGCDLCLTVSGTATLHVAAHDVPMIVVYRGSWLLWNLLGRWIISARTFAIVNILSGKDKHVVPEFIPWHGSAEPVAHCAIEFLRHPAMLEAQRKALAEIIASLSAPGASRKAAELARGLMDAAAETAGSSVTR
jgi:lipid-A-disaccharide synthase